MRSLIALGFVVAALPGVAHADTALILDISPTGTTSSMGTVAAMVDAGDFLLLEANDGVNGVELWRTDGTAAGTSMVADISPGAGDSNGLHDQNFPFFPNAARLGERVVFVARTPDENTRRPWITDGTEPGTVELAAQTAQMPVTVGDGVFFRSTGGLWRTDGTTTALVASTTTMSQLADLGGLLLFGGADTAAGLELWTSDGTTPNTGLLIDINPGTGSSMSSYEPPLAVGTKAYFSADDGTTGTELWVTDGTAGNTSRIADIHATGSSFPEGFVAVGTTVYFSADDGVNGRELWKTDGVTASLVKDIHATGSSLVRVLHPMSLRTAMDGILYFVADDGVHGTELWRSDGTEAGTTMVKDINVDAAGGVTSSGPQPAIVVAGGLLYFGGVDADHGRELWQSDGTEAGTVLAVDINPGTASSGPAALTLFGAKLILSADDGVHGREPWAFDLPPPPGPDPDAGVPAHDAAIDTDAGSPALDDPSGGCGCGTGRRDGQAASLLVLAVAGGWLRRRRRTPHGAMAAPSSASSSG